MIKRSWTILAGLAEPEFEFEQELSLFRLQFWLTGSQDMGQAFIDAGVWYGLFRIQQGFQQYSQATASWRMNDLLKNKSYRQMFSHCFTRGYLQRIFELSGFQDEVESRINISKWVEFEIEFAKLRLALILQQNDTRLQSAEAYHEFRKAGVIGVSVAERNRSFKGRVAYLLAADWTIPALLSFDGNVLKDLSAHIPEAEAFQLFCTQVRMIAETLGCPGDKEIETWIGCKGFGMPELPDIPSEVLNRLLSQQRRPASETRVGKASRQQPA